MTVPATASGEIVAATPLIGVPVANAAEQSVFAAFLEDPSVMPATVAQQVFSIVPGIFGGIGGFILATKLAETRRVETKGVIIASAVVAVLTLGAIYLIRPMPED